MRAYLISNWITSTSRAADAQLLPGQLIAKDGKYYFKRDEDGLNLSVNPPDGHFTWSPNADVYELADLTDKGLHYFPKYGGADVHFLVQIVRAS
jgi:hypothetical protein